jgi:Tripartite tricarboxylate transporter TctB family
VSRGGIPWSTVATVAVLGVGAVYLLMVSAAIPEEARLYPWIFLLATLGGSVALAIQAVIQGRRAAAGAAAEEAGPGDAAGAAPEPDADRPGWPLFPALVLYALVLDPLGFVVATLLFLTAVLLWLRVSARQSVPLALAGVLVIFVVFRTAMYVSLPAGPVDIYLLELIYSM